MVSASECWLGLESELVWECRSELVWATRVGEVFHCVSGGLLGEHFRRRRLPDAMGVETARAVRPARRAAP